MGCSATKTVPQERSTPVKGHSNGEILKNHKQDDVKSHTKEKENTKHSPDIHDSQNGGQTGGQMGGKSGDHTSDNTGEEANHTVSKEISLSKDLGLRKLQRKETPQAGPLAHTDKGLSQSQMEFFKLLDEKIEKGGELIEGEDEDVT